MKISYIFPQFLLPSQAFALSDIQALRSAGHEVTVNTVKPRWLGEAVREDEVPSDLPIKRPGLATALKWPMLGWRYRSGLLAILALLAKQVFRQPTLVLSCVLVLPRLLEIADEIRRGETQVVHLFWSRHASLLFLIMETCLPYKCRSAFVGAYDLVADDFLTRLSLSRAQITFTHAEANRAYLETHCGSQTPIKVVPRGIPLPALTEERSNTMEHWTTCSSLVPEKNVSAVIRAFAAAAEANNSLTMEVLGDGPQRQQLEALSRQLGCYGRITFRGHLSREDVMRASRRAGIFLFLSVKASERLPNVVKEAMWSGCIPVVSPSEGIEELIGGPENGIVVDPASPDSIGNALKGLLDTPPEQLAEMRAKNIRHIEQHFSASTAMKRYADAWQAQMDAS